MKKLKVGLQLYGLRDKMKEDMDATLKAVKEMGYDYVEFADYFDKPAEEIKEILDKYELTAISVHRSQGFYIQDEKRELNYLKVLGVKYSTIPWYKADDFYEKWEETVENFTSFGNFLKENGVQLMYHNHEFELQKINGEYILDKLYSEIPNDILKPEFDTCWIHYAGVEPSEYIKKYAGKIDVVHIKDFVCDKFASGPVYSLIGNDEKPPTREDNGFRFKPIGEGIANYNSILAACEECGVEYVVVEQDMCYDEDSLDCAKRSRMFLKENFGI